MKQKKLHDTDLFKRDTLYIHDNNTTVAMEVLSEYLDTETQKLHLYVFWYNVSSKHEPWPMSKCCETIKIPLSSRKEWKIYKRSEPPKFKEWRCL